MLSLPNPHEIHVPVTVVNTVEQLTTARDTMRIYNIT